MTAIALASFLLVAGWCTASYIDRTGPNRHRSLSKNRSNEEEHEKRQRPPIDKSHEPREETRRSRWPENPAFNEYRMNTEHTHKNQERRRRSQSVAGNMDMDTRIRVRSEPKGPNEHRTRSKSKSEIKHRPESKHPESDKLQRRSTNLRTAEMNARFIETFSSGASFISHPNMFRLTMSDSGVIDFKLILDFVSTSKNRVQINLDIVGATLNGRHYSNKPVTSLEDQAEKDTSVKYELKIERFNEHGDERQYLKCYTYPNNRHKASEKLTIMPLGDDMYNRKTFRVTYHVYDYANKTTQKEFEDDDFKQEIPLQISDYD